MPFIHEGYVYHRNQTRQAGRDTQYLVCKDVITKRCGGRAIYRVDTGELECTEEHNHVPQDFIQLKLDFEEAMKDAARRTYWNTKLIYERTSLLEERFNQIQAVYPFDANSAHFTSIVSYASRLGKLRPEILKYPDMEKALQGDEFKNLGRLEDARMEVKAFATTDGSSGLLICDKMLFEQLIPSVSLIYFSNTDAAVVPTFGGRNTDEIVVVIAEYKQGLFAFCWILLSGVSKSNRFLAVESFQEKFGVFLANRPIKIITSSAWFAVLSEKLPRVTIKYSFQELCQELVKRGEKDKQVNFEVPEDFKRVVYLACIGLIRSANIIEAQGYVSSLMQKVPGQEEKLLHLRSKITEKYLAPMADSSSCCFDDVDCCSNAMLNHSRDIQNSHKNSQHVTPWDFFHKRMLQIQCGYNDKKRLDDQLSIRTTPKVQFAIKPAILRKLWDIDTSSRPGLQRFFSAARQSVTSYLEELVFNIPPMVPIGGNEEDLEEGDCFECIQCDGGKANHIADPCGHLLYCSRCAGTDGQDFCTQCNSPIRELIKIFISSGPDGNKKCSTCFTNFKKTMTINCNHLILCMACWNMCYDAKVRFAEENELQPPTEEECPCSYCNSVSGGAREVRFVQ